MVVATNSETESSGTRAFVSKLVSSIVVAAVIAALDTQFKGMWAPWLHRLVPWILTALIAYAVVATIGRVVPRLRQKAHGRHVESSSKNKLRPSLKRSGNQ
jgi:hypothetical protein